MGTGVIEAAAIASVVAAVAGTAATVYSTQQAGAAQSRNAQYQAAVAANNAEKERRNASLSRNNAVIAEQAATSRSEDQIRRTRGVIGSQRASVASGGLLVDEGSAVDLQDSTADLGAEAIDEVRAQGARTASGFRIQAIDQENAAANGLIAAGSARDAATNAEFTSLLTAGGQGISGASRAFGSFRDMQRTGRVLSDVNIETAGVY